MRLSSCPAIGAQARRLVTEALARSAAAEALSVQVRRLHGTCQHKVVSLL